MKDRAVSFLASAANLSTGLPGLAAWGTVAQRLTAPAATAANGSAILPLRSGNIVVMTVPRPLPAEVVTDDLAQRIAWSGCQQARARWASHVIVGSMHEVTSLPQARDTAEDVFRVAEGLLRALPLEAVSWDGSGLFVQAAEFTRMVNRSPLPPELLIRCQWRSSQEPTPDTAVVTTRGLGFFGLPELQDCTGEHDLNTVRRRLLNLSSYLLANGAVIKDGDTIGVDEHRPVRVRHGADANGNATLILRRDM